MTKSEAIQIISDEYASWVHENVPTEKYFYEYASDEEELTKALEVFDGKLPENLQLTVVIQVGKATTCY